MARSPSPGSLTTSAPPMPGNRSRPSWSVAWWTSCTSGSWSPPRTADPSGPGGPAAEDPGADPPGPGRHRRGHRDPARRRRRSSQLRRHALRRRAQMGPHGHRRLHRRRIGPVSKDGHVIRVHPIRHERSRELGAFANPKAVPATRTQSSAMSAGYRNSTGPGART